MSKTLKKVKEPETRTFLWGSSRYADGQFASDETIDKCLELIKTDRWKTRNTQERCIVLETSINRCALEILRYSRSEWSNDYYDWANNLMDIMSFIDKNAKKFKYGRYLNLQSTYDSTKTKTTSR